MDRQIWNSAKSVTTGDFISALACELPNIVEPREKINKIKKHLNNEKLDYHSLQSIINILVSIPQNNKYKEILRLRHKLFSEYITF